MSLQLVKVRISEAAASHQRQVAAEIQLGSMSCHKRSLNLNINTKKTGEELLL